MPYLKSSDPEFDPKEIEEIFGLLHGDAAGDGIDVNFEHGQWWVSCLGTGAIYSVVDAVGDPSTVCDGLSFELIEAGIED
jgi:hypothetical protein